MRELYKGCIEVGLRRNMAGLPVSWAYRLKFRNIRAQARPLLKTILTFLIKTCVPPLKLYLSNKGGAISGAVPAGNFTYFSLL